MQYMVSQVAMVSMLPRKATPVVQPMLHGAYAKLPINPPDPQQRLYGMVPGEAAT